MYGMRAYDVGENIHQQVHIGALLKLCGAGTQRGHRARVVYDERYIHTYT